MSASPSPVDPRALVTLLRLRAREHADASSESLHAGALADYQVKRSLSRLEESVADEVEGSRDRRWKKGGEGARSLGSG